MAFPKNEYYRNQRQEIADRFRKFVNRYTFNGDELEDLIQTNPLKFTTYTYDLTNPQIGSQTRKLKMPGRAIVMYGVTTDTLYDPRTNVGIETVAPAAFMWATFEGAHGGPSINQSNNYGLPLKHNRGFVGDFIGVNLSFPGQANTTARVIIFHFDGHPWQGGEAAT